MMTLETLIGKNITLVAYSEELLTIDNSEHAYAKFKYNGSLYIMKALS